jgi:hypothetical protein
MSLEVYGLSPLFSTSLPRRFFLQASNPRTYVSCVILIDRVSTRMEGMRSGSTDVTCEALTACAKEMEFGVETTIVEEGISGTKSSDYQSKTLIGVAI